MKRVCSILSCVFFAIILFFPPALSAAEKEYTIMVYLNADDPILDSCGVKDQDEMAQVGSNEWLNVVTLIDGYTSPAMLNYMEKGSVKKLADMGEIDMGDYKQLVKFASDMIDRFPAKHYVLVVWDHGSGWNGNKNDGPTKSGSAALRRGWSGEKNSGSTSKKWISRDSTSGNFITTAELSLALSEIKNKIGRNLDVFWMDACLMQMMEVAFAVNDDCDYIIASEDLEPVDGSPYDQILSRLNPQVSPDEFCRIVTREFVDSYSGGSQGHDFVCLSTLICSKLDGLKTALDEFANAAMASNFTFEFTTGLTKGKKFYDPLSRGIGDSTSIDIGDFMTILKSEIKNEAFQSIIGNCEKALEEVVLITGDTYRDSHPKGLAIYFPEKLNFFDKEYHNLAFSKASSWDEMVRDYFNKGTAAHILACVQEGNATELREVVRTSHAFNPEFTPDLISKLNFRVLCEGDVPEFIQAEAKNLVEELKTSSIH